MGSFLYHTTDTTQRLHNVYRVFFGGAYSAPRALHSPWSSYFFRSFDTFLKYLIITEPSTRNASNFAHTKTTLRWVRFPCQLFLSLTTRLYRSNWRITKKVIPIVIVWADDESSKLLLKNPKVVTTHGSFFLNGSIWILGCQMFTGGLHTYLSFSIIYRKLWLSGEHHIPHHTELK